jgi:hypothetical protein
VVQTNSTTGLVEIISGERLDDIRRGGFEDKIPVLLNNTGLISSITSKGFIKTKTFEGKQYIFVEPDDVEFVEKAVGIGANFLSKVLADVCIKGTTNPGKVLNVSDSKVTLPSNLETAADTSVHKLMRIYYELGYETEISDETLTVPDIPQAWTTNITYCLDQLFSIVRTLKLYNFKNKLPARPRERVAKTLIYVMTFKYANAANISQYLKRDVRREGNLSEVAFCDIIKGWGANIEGNFLGRIASATYQLCGIIARMDGFKQILCKDHFMSGLDIRQAIAPARQIIVKEGNKTSVKAKGDVNVLKFDSIRFLTPEERSRVRNHNKSLDLENQIQAFDRTHIQDRNYPEFEARVKALISDNENKYFKLRRLARDRLYAIKEIRKEAHQPDRVSDGEFQNDAVIATAVALVRSIVKDEKRAESLAQRLSIPIVDSVFSSPNRLDEAEAETN